MREQGLEDRVQRLIPKRSLVRSLVYQGVPLVYMYRCALTSDEAAIVGWSHVEG